MKRFSLPCLVFIMIASACAAPQPMTLTVMTHSSFAASEGVIKSFETSNNVKVVFVQGGDAGETLNKAILTRSTPLADVLYGVDNTFLSRALAANIFQAYHAPAISNVPAAFQLDSSDRMTPVDYGDVCLNYDKKYFADHNLSVPASLEDLTKPIYKNLLVVENPATSSTGLAFLLATRAHFGDQFINYWTRLKDNGVVVVDGWETAYYTDFSGSSGHGPQPLVVSYGSSPAAEVVFADKPITDSPVGSVTAADTCFRQVEFVGILQGTKQLALAEKFVDFMLSRAFQEDMPLQMFVYPVTPDAALPTAFTKYAQVPAQPATLSPNDIRDNRDAWIEAWTEAMK